MAWRYFSISTDTWSSKVELYPSEFSGGRAIGTGCSGTATFKVKDPKVAEPMSFQTTMLLERVLVAEWDGNAVYAGFIVAVDEDQDAGTMTIQHTDIWWLWAYRYLLNVHGNGAQTADDVTFSNLTLATLANRIVSKGLQAEPAGRYALPMIFTADVAGANSRRYEGFKFTSVEDALDEVMKTNGGPYVDFDVRWGPGTEALQWVMRSGTLAGGLWEWDATTVKKEISKLRLRTDATKVTNKVIGTGEGSGRSILVRDDSSFTGIAPALERVESYSDMADGGQLQQRVTADLNASNAPTKQLSFRIPVGGAIKIGDLALGGTCRVKSSGFYHLDAGWRDWKLIQYDFDRKWINLQMQQIGG